MATDITLTCRDCGKPFVFTAGEQEFYASKGLTNQPSRCPDCRAARKTNSGAASSGSSKGGDRQYFIATCSNCGGEARVPFQPRGDRPVYCSNCFQEVQSQRVTS